MRAWPDQLCPLDSRLPEILRSGERLRGTRQQPAHTQRSNNGIALAVMIETVVGLDNAAAIAAVPGVDAVFVGPNDLAHKRGCENRWKDSPVQAAIARTRQALAAAGKCPGVLALTPEDEDRDAAWGTRNFATVRTAFVNKALKEAAQGGRNWTIEGDHPNASEWLRLAHSDY
jgi:2-keto-3-deoxy-L-rhamnonate aldolase RhmA